MKQEQKRLKVLLVEDNRDFVFILASVLEDEGYEVLTAHDGIDGVKKALHANPDVVFCDIGLPGMNGFEVAKSIRKEALNQDVYLVALSGYASPRHIEQSMSSGFNRHLSKPVDLLALQGILNEIQ